MTGELEDWRNICRRIVLQQYTRIDSLKLTFSRRLLYLMSTLQTVSDTYSLL